MAFTNLANLDGTTHLYTTVHTALGNDPAVYDGVDGYSIDGNFSSFQGVTGTQIDTGEIGNGRAITVISQHLFDKPYDITHIRYNIYTYGYASGLNGGLNNQNLRVQYTLNGSTWIDVPGTALSASGYPEYNTSLGGTTQTIAINISGVLGIRAYAYSWVYVAESRTAAQCRIYEIQAFSIKPLMQYRKGSNKVIGCEELNSLHKLRACKNGIIYGIPLSLITDSNASEIRLYDGSSIKSLPLNTL